MARNSAGVEMSRMPPSVHPTVYPRGSGKGRVVHLPAANVSSQLALVGWTDATETRPAKPIMVDIRGSVARKHGRTAIPWRTNDSHELGQPRKWKYVCSVEGCGFYSHNDDPANKHETKTGHAVLRGGE